MRSTAVVLIGWRHGWPLRVRGEAVLTAMRVQSWLEGDLLYLLRWATHFWQPRAFLVMLYTKHQRLPTELLEGLRWCHHNSEPWSSGSVRLKLRDGRGQRRMQIAPGCPLLLLSAPRANRMKSIMLALMFGSANDRGRRADARRGGFPLVIRPA